MELWSPNYHLPAPILPPKPSPPFSRPFFCTLCLETLLSLLQKPAQIFHIIQQAGIASSSLITMQFFLVSQNHTDVSSGVLYYCIFLKTPCKSECGLKIISVPPPGKSAIHRAFPHLSSLGSAWR